MPEGQPRPSVLLAALGLLERGFSVLPLRAPDHDERDGYAVKSPTIPWKRLQSAPMSADQARNLFPEGICLGLIGGAVSGNLECIDLERPADFEPWWELLQENLGETDWLASLVIERTFRGGYHVIYRCREVAIPGNTKLAQLPAPADWPAGAVMPPGSEFVGQPWAPPMACPDWHAGSETRGEGGYFMVWPSPGYEMVQGSLGSPPEITAEQRDELLSAARFLDELRAAKHEGVVAAPARPRSTGRERSPIEAFKERADHRALLGRAGWTETGRRCGSRDLWRRPGKSKGYSATWDGNGLKVHSSASECGPLEHLGYYDVFDLYRLFEHGGDLKSAVAAIRAQGYGPQRQVVPPPADVVGPGARFEGAPAQLSDEAVPEEHRARSAPAPRAAAARAEAPKYPMPRQPRPEDARPVDWLLYPWFVRGEFQDVHGDPGTGKTAFLEAIAAAISTGKAPGFVPWSPSGVAQGHVLLMATEDDYASVTVPRLLRMGADLARIEVVDEAFPFDRGGLAHFGKLLGRRAFTLCVTDLFTRFLEMALKASRPEVSAHYVLREMRRLAELSGTAIVATRHNRKTDREGAAVYAAHGGIEISGTSRSSMMLQEDETYQGPGVKRVNVSHVKTNYGERGEPFAFEIKKVDRDNFDLLWVHGPVKNATAQDMMAAPGARREKGLLMLCKNAILGYLAGGQPIASSSLDSHLIGQHTKATILRARKELKDEGAIVIFQTKDGWQLRRTYQQQLAEEEYDPYTDE